LVLAASAAIAPGCAAQVRVTARATPRLVWVAPGVWVVEDSPWAVYYADGYYWRWVDGAWYRSTWYDDGYVPWVGILPAVVIQVHRPGVYVRYRARPGVRVRVIDHRTRRPVVRDHRAQPVRRDHRR
jgi:hypothetical protein